MDYTAFSHGQITSKKWLCEELEPHIPDNAVIWVLGSWYNLIAFMLMVRGNKKIHSIIGFDIEPDSKPIADMICNAWNCFDPCVFNNTADANSLDWTNPPDIVINCSGEHFEKTTWWEHVPSNTTVAIQSSSMVDAGPAWDVKQPNPTMETFLNRHPVQTVLYTGKKFIDMGVNGSYERYMLIGKK